MNDTPTPNEVPGYLDAKALNLLPSAPSTPPKAVTLSSTKILFICIIIVFISGIAAIQLSNAAFSPTWLDIILFGVPVVAAFASFYIPGLARNKEYAAGYTYVDDAVMAFGAPSLGKLLKVQNLAGPAGYQWNFRGMWKLNNDGTVSREPIPGVLPIGYYPSPAATGKFEYWTGADWTGRYLEQNEVPRGGRLYP